MTVIFSSDWENSSGTDITDGGRWTGSNGSPSVSSATKYAGSYALQCVAGQYSASKVYKTLSSTTASGYLQFKVYFNALPSDGDYIVFGFVADASGNAIARLVLSRTGSTYTLTVENIANSTSYNYTWSGFAAQTWYTIELYVTVHASTGQVKVYLNGTEVITQTGIDTDIGSSVPIGELNIGMHSNTYAASNINVFYDNAIFADSYIGIAIPEYQSITQVSNVDSSADIGTHSSFTNLASEDSTFDTLTEANTVTTGTAGNSTNSGTSYTTIGANGCAALRITAPTNATSLASCTFYGRTSSGTFNVKLGIFTTAGVLLTNGVSNTVSVSTTASSFTATWATPPSVTAETNYYIAVISSTASFRLYYSASTGGNSCTDTTENYTTPTDITPVTGTINYRKFVATFNLTNYKLDIEAQWTNAAYSRTKKIIDLATGTLSKTLTLYYRNGSSWTSLGTLTASTVNHIDVSDYVSASTFTIRLAADSSNTTQGTYQIDSIILHTYNERIITELLGKLDTFTKIRTGLNQLTRTITELLGDLDSRTKLKNATKTITDKLGNKESRLKGISRAFTEKLGNLESRFKGKGTVFLEKIGAKESRFKGMGRVLNEKLGNLETKSKIGEKLKTITEKLGVLDTKSRIKAAIKELTELFGSLDSKVSEWLSGPIAHVREIVEMLQNTDYSGYFDGSLFDKDLFDYAVTFLEKFVTRTKTFTEKIGNLDSRTRLFQIHRVFTEKIGSLESRIKGKAKTIVELLGNLDTKSKLSQKTKTFTEKLGNLDSKLISKITGAVAYVREIVESLSNTDEGPLSSLFDGTYFDNLLFDVSSGVSSFLQKQVERFRTYNEAVGNLDVKSRTKTIFRNFTEKVGAAEATFRSKIGVAVAHYRTVVETLAGNTGEWLSGLFDVTFFDRTKFDAQNVVSFLQKFVTRPRTYIEKVGAKDSFLSSIANSIRKIRVIIETMGTNTGKAVFDTFFDPRFFEGAASMISTKVNRFRIYVENFGVKDIPFRLGRKLRIIIESMDGKDTRLKATTKARVFIERMGALDLRKLKGIAVNFYRTIVESIGYTPDRQKTRMRVFKWGSTEIHYAVPTVEPQKSSISSRLPFTVNWNHNQPKWDGESE